MNRKIHIVTGSNGCSYQWPACEKGIRACKASFINKFKKKGETVTVTVETVSFR